jgi:hypothetical protein
VSARIHADEKVRELSKPQPCGLALWHELIFGEQTGIVPGLFRIGEAAFAEQLGWPLKGFRDAWKEVADLGLAKADWTARLVWVPNAVKHNLPASPNVVLHWRNSWDLLPECSLKEEAKASMKAFLKAYSEPYAKAFEKASAKAFTNASANPSAESSPKASANQDQLAVSSNQEQEGDRSSQSGESEGREFTACELGDNPRDGKATEARDYLASLQGGRGIPIQKKSGAGGVS